MKQTLVILTTLSVLILTSCTLLSPTVTPTPTPIPISHVYAFGDSYSDNGNLQRYFPVGPPWNLMWEGRASNGPTAVEVLATRLNVELTDYAVGGAKSGTGNVNPLPNTGALGQIDKFKSELNTPPIADPDALYFVMIGVNDYLEKVVSELPSDNPALANQAVENIATAVSRLAQLGAKRFLIINSLDIAAMPLLVAVKRSEEAANYQTLLNSKLASRLDELKQQLNIELIVFDHISLSTKIRENPSDYGLSNITDACQPWLLGNVKPACTSPDQYYFWDEVHPTRRTHQIFGEAWAALFGK